MEKKRKITESDILDGRWQQKYAQLVSFKKNFHHCDVPQGWPENEALATWVKWQRKMYVLGKILDWRKKLLDNIGFSWKLTEPPKERLSWMQRYQQLVAFHKKNKHSNVPDQYKPNSTLGAWVGQQRRDLKEGKLTEEKVALLQKVNFQWVLLVVNRQPWEVRFKELKAYYETHGNCYVKRSREYKNLNNWVKGLLRTQGKISPERKAKLDTLHFDWEGRGSKANRLHQYRLKDKFWEQKYNLLLEFKSKYRHTIVTRSFKEFPGLYNWVSSQRYYMRYGKIPAYRIEKLNEIDFQWKVNIREGKKISMSHKLGDTIMD